MSEGTPKKVNHVVVRWDGDHRFDASRLGSEKAIRIDADALTGPGPVDTLLCALASCTGVTSWTSSRSGGRRCRG